jgi:protein TonB
MHFFDQLTDLKKSIILSVTFHTLLILLFFIIHIGIDFKTSDFSEISFISGNRVSKINPPQIGQPQNLQRIENPAPQTVKDKAVPPINVPKRRMLEESEPEIYQRQFQKLTPQEQYIPEQSAMPQQGRQAGLPEIDNSEKNIQPATEQMDAEKPSIAPSPMQGEQTQQPYTIEGEAAKRTVIEQEIPQYPPNLQKEAVVRIRFTVLPDGYIGQMIPVQKGEPVLEEITMKALRKWRFNPLPPDVEQANAQGVITFRYELE